MRGQFPAAVSPAAAHWDSRPLALAHGGRVRSVSAAAAGLGIRVGMSLTEARAIHPALEIEPWDDAALARALTEATAALLEASPQVTPVAGSPGVWWVGASGFDGLGGERELLRRLVRIARRWHPRPRAAVADSCVAARAATWAVERDGSRARIVPPGGCAAYLAAAPLALLPVDAEVRAALESLGLRTIGGFAALDPGDVERRWGAEGLRAWRLARGEDRRRPVLARPEPRHAVEVELPAPAATLEPVLFLLRAALDRLVRGVVRTGHAVAGLAVTFTLDDAHAAGTRGRVVRRVELGRALARGAPLFEQCRAVIDGWTLEAPVLALEVAVTELVPLPAEQGDLLAPLWRDPGAAEAAFARLRAELGADAVVRPVVREEHRVEVAGGWAAGGTAAGGEAAGRREAGQFPAAVSPAAVSPAAVSPAALRLLSPPEPIELERVEHEPAAIRWRGQRLPVAEAMGPERLSGDWWKGPYARDYWRCEGAAGAFIIFRDRLDPERKWYLHGWYD